MPDNNDVTSVPQGAEAKPAPQVAQTPPPSAPVAPAPAQHSSSTHHSHTGIYVALGIVGVLVVIALFWSAFAYFSPRGAWSPLPGMVSDYQYKNLERNVENQIDNVDNAINSDDAGTGDDQPDNAMSEIPDANGNYITLDQAVQTARAKVGQDSVYSVEFDRINDKAVYVVDLNSGTTLYEVIIDATTGDVLNVESSPLNQ